jgi:hypothetical protein
MDNDFKIIAGIFLILNAIFIFDYLDFRQQSESNSSNIQILASVYTDVINDNAQLHYDYDWLESQMDDYPPLQQVQVIEEPKVLPPVQLFKKPKLVTIYFASNFEEGGENAILDWLNDYYFCQVFINASDYENASVVLTSHSFVNESTMIDNLTRDETAGFATTDDYNNGRRGFVSIKENIEIDGNYEKAVILHEFAHYFGLDIHNCSSKLEFSQWCINTLEEYLQLCKE